MKATTALGIKLGAVTEGDLTGYSDISFASELKRRSIEGNIIYYAGGPITWSSKKQSITVDSTTAAEFIAFNPAGKALLIARNACIDLGLPIIEPLVLYGDNLNANKRAAEPEKSPATRWMDQKSGGSATSSLAGA